MHNIEMIDGKPSIAYAGETPWHGLGKNVRDDLTPEQMLEEALLNWEVTKSPVFVKIGNKDVPTGRQALVRSSDDKVLDIVGKGWEPVQNAEAFGFFHDFIMAGKMKMHTAGSLDGGKMVWALAEINDGFTVFGKDKIEGYLLFSNPHQYGKSIDIRLTPIRVVCQNTLSMSLKGKGDVQVSLNHRSKFDANLVKETLGISHNKLDAYKETAEFLGSKRYTDESISEYINSIFPINAKKEMSTVGKVVRAAVETQPGADIVPGSWWNAFNAVTFTSDHVLGRSQDTRLRSSWYGSARARKIAALKKAVEFAEAA
jgi:phage/plasmid-like protein (TIGR03299 family)